MAPDQPRIRVAAIVAMAGEILLVEHEKADQRYWLLPGGGVEAGESLANALRREVQEETGLEIRIQDLVLASDTLAPDGSRHVVNLFFTAKITGGELHPGRDDRLVGARFVPLADLENLDLRPAIATHLMAGVAAQWQNTPRYAGSIWKDA